MKKILWFCRSSDSSSLSTITDSIIPELSKTMDITLLSNKSQLNVKNVILGSDTSVIKYNDYVKMFGNTAPIRSLNIKYALIQLSDLLYNNLYDYVIICNGVYECDWMVDVLKKDESRYLTRKDNKFTKLIIWTPFDYIPTPEVYKNIILSDITITMNPMISNELGIPMKWVGHGSDIYDTNFNHKDAIDYLNDLIKNKSIMGSPIQTDDIIFLNANNYGPFDGRDPVPNSHGTRKRLDITVKAFLKLMTLTSKPVKLWIHTNLKSFFEMMNYEKLKLSDFKDKIILSKNNLSKKELAYIYKVSFANIQTSTGEGWSLTNMESAIYRSLQIVPDFLACKFHFENRGLLIPVIRKTIKNEGGHDVIIGEVSVEDTVNKMMESLELENINDILDIAEEYARSFTWKKISNQLEEIINCD